MWPGISTGLMLVVAWMAFRNRRLAVARTAALFAMAAAWWSFAYMMQLCSTSFVNTVFWMNAQYIGIVLVPPSVLVLANQLTGRMLKKSWFRVPLLGVLPAATLAALFTDPKHHHFWQDVRFAFGGQHAVIITRPGPLYFAQVAWTTLFLLITVGVLFRTVKRGAGVLSKQAWWLLGAIIVGSTTSIANSLGYAPVRFFDPTSTVVGFVASAAGWVVFRSSFLRLAPVARERVFLSLPDPVFVLDLHQHLADLNLSASVLFLSARDNIGRNLLEAIGNEAGEILLSRDEATFAGRSYEVRRSPLTDGSGQRLGSMIYLVDITEHRRAATVLREAKASAEAANQAKSRFLANMSHELRTPINGVLGLTELLSDTPLSEHQQQYVRSITSCSRSLLDLVNDVLDLTRLQEGKMPIQPTMSDLDQIIEDLRETYTILAESKGLEFRSETPGPLGSAMVDATRLRQILHNLIGNSLKFTETGWIALRVRHGNGDQVIFEVADSGIGIAKDQRELVFQRFEQAEGSSKRRFGGSGLGLAITKQIVDAMGGRLDLESEAGKGTTITVALSLPGTLRAAVDRAVNAVAIRKTKVLVVEDNPINAVVAVGNLEALGCSVDLTVNGQEAVEACERVKYDLVLMDVHMPVMDGLEACGRIRKIPNQNACIVGLSAGAFPEEKQRALDAGMDEYLSKPVRRTDLQELLERVAERAKVAKRSR